MSHAVRTSAAASERDEPQCCGVCGFVVRSGRMRACPQCGGGVGPLPDHPAPAGNAAPLPPRPESETRSLVVSDMNKPLATVLSVVVAVAVYFGWGQVFPPQSSYMSDRGPHVLGAMAAAAVGAMLMFLAVWLMSRRVTQVRK